MNEAIINAAAKLFAEKGYYSTSMDDVAREAGVAKGSLYYHFKNKSQLYLETVLNGVEYYKGEIRKIYGSDAPASQMAREIIRLLVGIFDNNGALADMVMTGADAGVDADTAAEIRRAKDSLIATVAGVIEDGAMYGELKQCQPGATAEACASFIYAYCKALKRAGRTDTGRTAAEIETLLMKGLLR